MKAVLVYHQPVNLVSFSGSFQDFCSSTVRTLKLLCFERDPVAVVDTLLNLSAVLSVGQMSIPLGHSDTKMYSPIDLFTECPKDLSLFLADFLGLSGSANH